MEPGFALEPDDACGRTTRRRRRPSRSTGAAGSIPLWRYRVGDWRIVVYTQDDATRVLVVRIAHRREAYRGL